LVVFILLSLIKSKAQSVLWHTPDLLDVLAIFAGGIALLAWFWWFGLLVWRVGGAGWRMVRLRVRAA
jgi:hypothetical protein